MTGLFDVDGLHDTIGHRKELPLSTGDNFFVVVCVRRFIFPRNMALLYEEMGWQMTYSRTVLVTIFVFLTYRDVFFFCYSRTSFSA